MLTAVVVSARVILAGIFTVAGAAKLRDRAGTIDAVRAFEMGVPVGWLRPISVLLPLAELLAAASLLQGQAARAGAILSVGMLAVFSVAITGNLARGRAPACNCFGQASEAPISARTLLRNGVLIALSLLVAWQGERLEWIPWWSSLDTTQHWLTLGAALGLAAVMTLVWIQRGVVQQNNHLRQRVDRLEQQLMDQAARMVLVDETPAPPVVAPPVTSMAKEQASLATGPEPPSKLIIPGPPVGTIAPSFTLSTLHGEQVSLTDVRARAQPILLVFMSPTCGACSPLIPDLVQWQADYGAWLSLVVVTSGSTEINQDKLNVDGLPLVLRQEAREVMELYNVPSTPSAVLLGRTGQVAMPAAVGVPTIRTVVNRLLAARRPATAVSAAARSVIEAPETRL